MIKIRKSEDRGAINHGWLDTKHTFSFARYYDENHMGFGPLRVINEDIVEPGQGFGTHPHDNMEIVTYILEGALEHKDSMGNGSVIRPGDIQRMSAGTGITHSEFNPSNDNSVHLLQIWFLPEKENITPGYEQAHFAADDKRGRLKLVLSRDGRDGSVSLNQDIDMYAGLLDGEAATLTPKAGRKQWVQVARGSVTLNGTDMVAGDGAAIEGEEALNFTNTKNAELVVFDMVA